MEGMNASNCHPGLHVIAERGEKRIKEQPKPLGAAGTESGTDEEKDGDNTSQDLKAVIYDR